MFESLTRFKYVFSHFVRFHAVMQSFSSKSVHIVNGVKEMFAKYTKAHNAPMSH